MTDATDATLLKVPLDSPGICGGVENLYLTRDELQAIVNAAARHHGIRPECDTCGGDGRVEWMTEGDPNCYQERDSDDMIPCPDCATTRARS